MLFLTLTFCSGPYGSSLLHRPCAVHLWPDNWNIHNRTFHTQWIERHVDDADSMLKKPLLIQEFG